MKKGLFSAIILALLLSFTTAYAIENNLGYVESNYNYIHVRTLKYEPYPANPGKYVDVWVRIENTGQDPTDVEFTLQPKFPFSLDASEKANRTVSKLQGKETALFHYKVRVSETAVEGVNLLNYRTRTSDGIIDQSSLSIFVQTSDANIAINSIDAEDLSPGSVAYVTLELENQGDSPLGDVSVDLDLTATTTPIVPVNSTSEKKLALIEPRQKQAITFALMALPDAAANTYKVPVEISFIDGTGANYTKSSIIGLKVSALPDIAITTSDSTIYGKGETGTVLLKFTNKGLTDVKFMNVILNESENYDVISENEQYLGNVDSDDYETAEYRIKARKVKDGFTALTVELSYMDANNKKYSELRTVPLKVVDAKSLGVEGNGGGFGSVIFAALIIVGGFFAYKRWEKKKINKK